MTPKEHLVLSLTRKHIDYIPTQINYTKNLALDDQIKPQLARFFAPFHVADLLVLIHSDGKLGKFYRIW